MDLFQPLMKFVKVMQWTMKKIQENVNVKNIGDRLGLLSLKDSKDREILSIEN
jgi:hypothetical protein